MQWLIKGSYQFDIKDTKFASGAFRDSFKATVTNPEMQPSLWVMKQYQDEAVDTITCDLNMTLEDHTRKQVQMHMAARCITESFAAKVPLEFGDKFQYNKVYYAVYKQQPVTIEEYVEGEFYKYVNNDGNCMTSPREELDSAYQKAECLVHYSYIKFQKKLMLLDIQGSSYNLYDLEIATSEIVSSGDVLGIDEIYFCAGNLATVGIQQFITQHKCNEYCNDPVGSTCY